MIKCPKCQKPATSFLAWMPVAYFFSMKCRQCGEELQAAGFTRYVLFGSISTAIGLGVTGAIIVLQLSRMFEWSQTRALLTGLGLAIAMTLLTVLIAMVTAWRFGEYELQNPEQEK